MIRRLSQDDWVPWKEIRLEAIRLHPEAFGGAYEDEVLRPDVDFQDTLAKKVVFAALDGSDIVGVAGFSDFTQRKLKHRGTLFSMYVRAAHRGTGVAGQLVEAVVDHARTCVEQIHCTVVTDNEAARRLYEHKGFTIYGIEPAALKIGQRYYDEHLMVLKL